MNFDVNIKHFRHKYLTLLINRAVISTVQAWRCAGGGCISSRSHPTGYAAARRRRPLSRPNYRRRSAMVVCQHGGNPGPEEVQAITSRVNYARVLDPPSPVVSRLLTAYTCPVCPVIFSCPVCLHGLKTCPVCPICPVMF